MKVFSLGIFGVIVAAVVKNGIGMSILSESSIVKAAEQCCPPNQRSCCIQRMKEDKDINCPMDDVIGKIQCLETALYANGPNSVFAHNCCRLLYNYTCKEKCVFNLFTPSLFPSKKLDFIPTCRPVKRGPNCVLDGWIHVHDCFAHCVEQTHKNGRNFVFNPADHCPGFLDFDKRQLCTHDFSK